jgi:hypothetical protein
MPTLAQNPQSTSHPALPLHAPDAVDNENRKIPNDSRSEVLRRGEAEAACAVADGANDKTKSHQELLESIAADFPSLSPSTHVGQWIQESRGFDS